MHIYTLPSSAPRPESRLPCTRGERALITKVASLARFDPAREIKTRETSARPRFFESVDEKHRRETSANNERVRGTQAARNDLEQAMATEEKKTKKSRQMGKSEEKCTSEQVERLLGASAHALARSQKEDGAFNSRSVYAHCNPRTVPARAINVLIIENNRYGWRRMLEGKMKFTRDNDWETVFLCRKNG